VPALLQTAVMVECRVGARFVMEFPEPM